MTRVHHFYPGFIYTVQVDWCHIHEYLIQDADDRESYVVVNGKKRPLTHTNDDRYFVDENGFVVVASNCDIRKA